MSDTIYSRPGETFYSELDNAEVGLVGTLGVRVLRKSDGAEVLARTTGAIAEVPVNSGRYVATLTAPEERAAFTVLWDEGSVSPETTASDDLVVTSNPPEEGGGEVPWQPTLADVGAQIFARTKVAGGKGGTGTFSANTRPTGDQVERLILQAVRRVKSEIVAEPCSDDLQADARAAAALYAAMLVEQSYYPEQTSAAGSSFQSLRSLWTEQIKVLARVVAANCGGAAGEEVEGHALAGGAGSFDDGIPLLGRDFPGEW